MVFLSGLLDLAAANAGCANADALTGALHQGMHGLQVQVPAPLSDIVGVTYPIAELGAAPANFTYSRHGDCRSLINGNLSLSASALPPQPGTTRVSFC